MSEGYRKYLQHLVPRMAHHPGVSDLIVGVHEKIDFLEYQKNFPFTHWFSMSPSPWSMSGMNDEVRGKMRAFGPDVVFIPTARFWGMKGVPTVTMVRNMEPLMWNSENPLFEKIRNQLRKRDAYDSSIRASRVIAVSHFVKEFIQNRWKIDPKKIGVVYHGTELTENENGHCPNSIPASWKSEFLFTAGSIRPARGLEDVIYALRYLVPKYPIRGLVIAGEPPPSMRGYQSKLTLLIRKNNLTSNVCWTGKLDDIEMTWCYQNCKIFVMTSRVEACPNIALEAMANGCITVSTKNPPMPEFFGDTTTYYPHKDAKALAQEIQKILNWDNQTLNERSKNSKKRAIEFSWDACVEKTIVELKKAVEISGV